MLFVFFPPDPLNQSFPVTGVLKHLIPVHATHFTPTVVFTEQDGIGPVGFLRRAATASSGILTRATLSQSNVCKSVALEFMQGFCTMGDGYSSGE